jgi:hypothetical protein
MRIASTSKIKRGKRRRPVCRARPHSAPRTRKSGPCAPWVRPISVYALLNGADPRFADLAGHPGSPFGASQELTSEAGATSVTSPKSRAAPGLRGNRESDRRSK